MIGIMSQQHFTFTLHRSHRAKRQIKQQRSIDEILFVLDADESWVLLSLSRPGGADDVGLRNTGRALRTRFDNEAPCLILAFEKFTAATGSDREGLTLARQWFYANQSEIMKHHAFISELGAEHFAQQRYIAEAVGLLQPTVAPTTDLPVDFSFVS